MFRIAAFVLAAAAAGYGLHAVAQGRLDARPAAAPMGTSSSNGVSFAWFYDPTERIVYVCRTGGNSDALECKGRAQLP
jgi:hypothetical protein